MDQCTHCTARGKPGECDALECAYHETWYASRLRAELEQSKGEIARLRIRLAEVEGTARVLLREFAPTPEVPDAEV